MRDHQPLPPHSCVSRTAGSPLIFIVSDMHNRSSDTHKLFPYDLVLSGAVGEIKFIPVNATLLKKILTTVAEAGAFRSQLEFILVRLL